MKKVFAFVLALSCLFILFGCGKAEVPTVTTGDFSMTLPEGYTITDIGDTACTIQKDGKAVGGIILTQLTEKTMEEKLPLHLDSLTGTDVINEYFSWDAESEGSPVKLVSHYVTDPVTKEKQEFYRILYVKDGGVYDLWFDTGSIDIDEIEEAFYPLF